MDSTAGGWVEDFELRRRQLLRALSDLEEKYSMRSSRLLERGRIFDEVIAGSRRTGALEDLALWFSLYEELKRLEALRASLERPGREGGRLKPAEVE